MKHDYSQYIGQEVVIVKELIEDVDSGEPYDPGFIPAWNYVGNVLTITKYDPHSGSFRFVDKDGHDEELLLDYDFEHGYVEFFQEVNDTLIDADAINNLL